MKTDMPEHLTGSLIMCAHPCRQTFPIPDMGDNALQSTTVCRDTCFEKVYMASGWQACASLEKQVFADTEKLGPVLSVNGGRLAAKVLGCIWPCTKQMISE